MVVIGIDLGTTYSCVAVWKQGNVEVIANEHGNRTTPSYVAFTKNERLIGETAKNQAPLNALNTVFGTKRLLGRRYDDEGVQVDLRYLPFRVVNDLGKPKIQVEYKRKLKYFTPEEISSMVLSRMKYIAESYLGVQVTNAVITVPAYFNDSQRRATRAAGLIAGLNVLRILNEPTAAALAYGLDRNLEGDKNILVYDLGGGTFDVSILTIGKGSVYRVRSTTGDTHLGGEDFDSRLVLHFAQDFREKFHHDVLYDAKALRRLRTAAERAKRVLTSSNYATVEVENLFEGKDYRFTVTRAFFEKLCTDIFQDTLGFVTKALADAKLLKSDIHDIVLIGGSTRIPKVRCMLQEFFDGKPLTTSINPDEAVAYGAAVHAAMIAGEKHKKIQNLHLTDVVPLSLGVEINRGIMNKVIERNTPIPCRHTKEVTTIEDNQPTISVEVFEGERLLTRDNNLLGVFDLNNIPLAPRGIPKIAVTFELDVNGILKVTARDDSTGNMESIVIKNDYGLKKEEIEKMIADAEIYKWEDIENKRSLDSRNQLETYIYSVKDKLNEKNHQLTKEEHSFMDNELSDAMLWLDDNTVDCSQEDFDKKLTDLMVAWSKILRKFYDYSFLTSKRFRTESNSLLELVGNEKFAIDGMLDD